MVFCLEAGVSRFFLGGIEVARITHGVLKTNSYIITIPERRTAAIIDPGEESEAVEKLIERERLDVELIALTHGHFDHACSAGHLSRKYGAEIALSSKDLFLLDLGKEAMEMFGIRDRPCEFWSDIDLSVLDEVKFGGLKMIVFKSPGHSPGSVVLAFEDKRAAFTGDTLFRGFVGRTDFPGGSEEELKNTLRSLMRFLEGSSLVFPGHGPETTLREEREWLERWIAE